MQGGIDAKALNLDRITSDTKLWLAFRSRRVVFIDF